MLLVVGDRLLATQIQRVGPEAVQDDGQNLARVIEELATHDFDAVVGTLMVEHDVAVVERNAQHILSQAILSVQVALVAQGAGIPYYHLSSSLVFGGGQAPPALATDRPNPMQALGLAQLWAENVILHLTDTSKVVRLGWLYGPERKDSYPYRVIRETYTETVKGEKAHHRCHVPAHPVGSPTLDEEAAELIYWQATISAAERMLFSEILSDGEGRIFHLAPANPPISWYEFCLLVGTPVRMEQRFDPTSAFFPGQQGLAASPGWSTGSYFKSVVKFLKGMGEG